MGEALVASLKKREQKATATAVSALTPPAKEMPAAISALAPAMGPASKLKATKQKATRFAEEQDNTAEACALKQEAEVAASKLLKIIGRMEKGMRKTP